MGKTNRIHEFSTGSAFWMCNFVANMVYPRWSAMYPDLREAQVELEDYFEADQIMLPSKDGELIPGRHTSPAYSPVFIDAVRHETGARYVKP